MVAIRKGYYFCPICETLNVQIENCKTGNGFCNLCNKHVKLSIDYDLEIFKKNKPLIKFKKGRAEP